MSRRPQWFSYALLVLGIFVIGIVVWLVTDLTSAALTVLVSLLLVGAHTARSRLRARLIYDRDPADTGEQRRHSDSTGA